MGLNDTTTQLFTHVTDTVDGSSSSCPPSTGTSEDSTQEGYLILTFDKSKRARLKTAVFADVADCHFEDDFDEEEDNELYTWPTNDPESVDSVQTSPPICSTSNVTPNSEIVARSTASCYGETVWVGTGETTENEATVTTTPTKLANSDNHRLIRTSPITDHPAITDLRSSPLKSLVDQKSMNSDAAGAAQLSQTFSHDVAFRESFPPRPLNVSFRWTNRMGPKSCFSQFSPSSNFRPSGLPRSGFSSTHSYASDFESGSEKYPRKMLRCEACGKYYRNEYSLHHHICLKRKDVWKKGDIPSDVIDGQLVYFCPTCHKPFKWLGNLTRHFYVHTGQRFFKCDICSKEFFSAYQVKRHMNSHTGRRFKCEVCEKPFTCKYACAWHTRQHYTYAE